MELSPETEAQLSKIYGVGQSNSLAPDKEAALMKIYGIQPQGQGVANNQNIIEQIGSSSLGNAVGDVISDTGDIIKNIPNQNPASSGLQLMGQGAKMVAAPIGEALSAMTPDAVKNYISDSAVGDVARQYAGKWNEFSQSNPEISKDVGAAANIASMLPLGKAATAVTATPVKKAIGNIEQFSQKAPGILGKTDSGVSVNASLGGVPDIVSSMPEGIVNRYKGANALKPDELDAVVSAAHDNTSNLYKAVDDTGATLHPATSDKIKINILSAIENSPINPEASPKTIGAVKALYNRIAVGKTHPITGEVTQAPLTVSELDGFRKLLNNIGGEDSVVANKVRDVIDNNLASMTDKDFIGGGAEAPKLLFEARASAAKAFKMEDLAQMIKKADGDERSIVAGFKRFTDKEGWERGFNKEEQQAIKDVAKRGTGQSIERGLGTFGFDLGRAKNVALPYFLAGEAARGGAASITPMGVPLAVAGTITRQTGKLAARGKAQKAFDVVKNRK